VERLETTRRGQSGGDLSRSQAQLLVRLHRTQRWIAALGLLLTLGGASYAFWGVYRFDANADPRQEPGFDLPVARLAFAYDEQQRTFEKIRPETFTEHVLMESLVRGMNFSASFAVMLMRLFLGTLTLLSGLVILTVGVERQRLLAIIGLLTSSARAPAERPDPSTD
jgi:hypothetical protein